MRTAISLALVLLATSSAVAYSYRIGNLEIANPTIMVQQANSYCTCTHVTIMVVRPRISLAQMLQSSAAQSCSKPEVMVGQLNH